MKDKCDSCGKPRAGLEQQRGSWSVHPLPGVPDNPDYKAFEMTRNLIVSAVIYRNGGTGEFTHMCDDCLRIGLRSLKVEIDKALDEVDTERHDQQIAELTEQLTSVQHKYKTLAYDHNRMQTRLGCVLAELSHHAYKETSEIEYAKWEANRAPAPLRA